eukprot:2851764-Rhodomonas_salina.1
MLIPIVMHLCSTLLMYCLPHTAFCLSSFPFAPVPAPRTVSASDDKQTAQHEIGTQNTSA